MPISNEIGRIFDIQSFSVHDGPGARTTVFMKGCPLSCSWCANPESWSLKKELMFAESKCKASKGCLRCTEACPQNAISVTGGTLVINKEKCFQCSNFSCTKACYNEALKVCGSNYSLEELMRVLERDRNSWSSKGGVTFSGGEIFLQKEFVKEALRRCKESFIHTTIETSGFADLKDFIDIMQYVDFAFIDIKHMDSHKHKAYIGVNNATILNNIRDLAKSNWQGRLVLRMPIIQGFNDDSDNIMRVVDFMKDCSLVEINILPFHRMGDSKWKQLGKKYEYGDYETTPIEKLIEIQDVFLKSEIACYIGHDTLF